MSPTTIELHIRRLPDASLAADATLTTVASAATAQLATNVPVVLDATALLALSNDPAAYGAALSSQLFADQALREAWLKARAFAATGDLQLRLRLDSHADDLHAIRWETLRDPEDGQPIALHERVRLARVLDSDDLTPVVVPPRPNLHALVVVSNPSNLSDYKLTEVDVDGEVARACTALGDIRTTILGDHADAAGRATMVNLAAQLREAPAILLIVAHGTIAAAGPLLWLEQDDGTADQVPGAGFVAAVGRLAVRPLLLALLSCQSAGRGYGDTLSALGPGLAQIGVPAVLGFQGDVAMSTVKILLPTLITELRRDGQIDRALAAARAALGEKRPWWQTTLWLRTDGRLWREEVAPDPRLANRERTLRALLHDHSGFIANRMESFVGREAELAEIRERIAEKLPTGGYVTITGHAGQGKSSVIAKLTADALQDTGINGASMRERLQQPGAGVPICHFIPFSPGPDHQVGLLRNLIARLCLTYDLPDFYAASDSRPALRDYFAAALRDMAQQGKQTSIYIDGLDQIEEDASGMRDLSFLPEEPPAGMVFVLGTRPNDTLKPLELRKPQHEYWLPSLSRADFDLILTHREVKLDALLADRFYAAMQENALYLDLVAKELREQSALPSEELITRIADNPDNLFSLSIERLQRNERQWEAVLRPILGLLLAAHAPLSQRALRALIGADDLRTRQGIERLGGLVQRDGEGRYGLFHLKLGDFLRQGADQTDKAYVFAPDEEEGYHQQLVDWCEGGKGSIDAIWADAPSNAVEQERRAYVRQHYIAHLAAARAYEQLWLVINVGAYGSAKRRHDPSTRSYARDLDIARATVITAAAGAADAQAQALPRLWRYSLMRCSLTSQADNYPEALFLALMALGRGSEAVNLAELLSDPAKKADTLRVIGTTYVSQGNDEGVNILQRARAVADTIPKGYRRVDALRDLATALAQAGQFAQARAAADALPDADSRAEALSALAAALAQAGQAADATTTFAQARAAADALPNARSRATALSALAVALTQAGQFAQARAVADALPYARSRAAALSALAAALAQAGHFTQAHAAADALPDADSRAAALSALAVALAQAGQFAQARAVADALPNAGSQAKALCALAVSLAQAGLLHQATALLTDLWRRAQTRDELLRLFAVDAALLCAYPELGQGFLDSFAWVDAQLAAG